MGKWAKIQPHSCGKRLRPGHEDWNIWLDANALILLISLLPDISRGLNHGGPRYIEM